MGSALFGQLSQPLVMRPEFSHASGHLQGSALWAEVRAWEVVTGLFPVGGLLCHCIDPAHLLQPPAQKGKGRHNLQAGLSEFPVTLQATLLS